MACRRPARTDDSALSELRHFVATELLAEDRAAHEAAHDLGVSRAATLAIYADVTAREADGAAGVFDRALGSGLVEARA